MSYATWYTDPAREAAMAEGHAPMWRHMIETIPERDFRTRTVLDFGCNRGGFLRLLHALRPFRRGLGIDIATDSIAAARAATGELPLHYEVATDLSPWSGSIDTAFAYEVIYLLPDLDAHARAMFDVLRPGGSYYAVTGCHTQSPLWPVFRAEIARTSNTPVPDRAPEDFAGAFAAAGFAVSVKRFGFDGFVPATKSPYYPRLTDAIDYAAEHKLIFRMEKRG